MSSHGRYGGVGWRLVGFPNWEVMLDDFRGSWGHRKPGFLTRARVEWDDGVWIAEARRSGRAER